MGPSPASNLDGMPAEELTISEAAIATCGRLVAAMAGRIATHASRDGGLICEDRTSRARPRMWRIAPDGGLLADSTYSYVRRSFTRAPLPQEITS